METTLSLFEDLWLPPAEREPFDLNHPPLQLVPDPMESDDEASQAHSLIGAVARAAVEALTGFRPVAQLSRWLEPSAIAALSVAARQGEWDGATVARVRAEVADDLVIEGVAQIAVTGRRVAIAMRLEWLCGHWLCTDLSVLLPGSHLVTPPSN